jgi:hypothetical protein
MMRVSEAVAPVLELKGWNMADFTPIVQNNEVPYNVFVGVLNGNVIELKPSMMAAFLFIVIFLISRRWSFSEPPNGYTELGQSVGW